MGQTLMSVVPKGSALTLCIYDVNTREKSQILGSDPNGTKIAGKLARIVLLWAG